MPRYAYDRLTALDASFLLLEKPNAYMHVASTMVFEAAPLRTPEGGIDAGAIRDLTAAYLHRIPRYRQKLAWIPLENHPVWVDDPAFNIHYHVRHTALPRPGTERQLKRLSARIMQQHLDRRRPLWEMWIVEGLEGDRFAMVWKVHHCMIDGMSGVDLMRVLMSPEPSWEIPEAPMYVPRPVPSGVELLGDELWRRALLPLRIAGGVGRFLGEVVSELRERRSDLWERGRALAHALGAMRAATDTPLNREIGPHRRFDWFSMDLKEVKAVRRALGGSLNDVVLTIVTGALRRFLRSRQVDPARTEFRILAPVSVRHASEQGQLGNRVSGWILPLPLDEPDPRRQLARIHERTSELKRSHDAVGAEMLTQAAEFTPTVLLALGARNAARLLPFNMVVTNVPGPQAPMHMLGSRMLAIHPHVPLAERLGLGVALMSYDGTLYWGFNADYDTVPDLHPFVVDVREAFLDLARAAEVTVSPPDPDEPEGPTRDGARRAGPGSAPPTE